MICGGVWVCAVCGAKISERRTAELQTAVGLWRADGGQVWLLTYTFSHGRYDRLRDSLDGLSEARRLMKQTAVYRRIRSEYGMIGTVQASEITHGPAHGWHPHIHELAFVAGDADPRPFRPLMYERWRRACLKAGLGEPSERHGFDVRDGDAAASYVSKGVGPDSWGLERELTKGHIKAGRGLNRSPFQILDCAADPQALPEHRDEARSLFQDYAKATKGRRQLSWSPGLRDRFAVPELSDEEIAAAVGEDAVLLASISLDDWAVIERNHLQAQVLTMAENGGAAAVYSLIGAYRGVTL
jgi:hypothetical protein